MRANLHGRENQVQDRAMKVVAPGDNGVSSSARQSDEHGCTRRQRCIIRPLVHCSLYLPALVQ